MKTYKIGRYTYKEITEEEFNFVHEEYHADWEYFSGNYYYFAEGFDGEPLMFFERVRKTKPKRGKTSSRRIIR